MKKRILFFVILWAGLACFSNPPMHYLKWSDTENMCAKMTDLCTQQNKKWKGILAVTRGGLIPAGFLAETLGIKNIRVIGLSSYKQGLNRGEIKEVYRPTDIDDQGEEWIVVDEISDSGETLKYIRTLYPKAFYITMIAKPKGKKQVDAYAREWDQETFIVFPWEKEARGAIGS